MITLGDTVNSKKNLEIAEIVRKKITEEFGKILSPQKILEIIQRFMEAKNQWEQRHEEMFRKTNHNEQSDQKTTGWFPGDCCD